MTLVSVASLVLAVSTESHPLFASGWFRFLVRTIDERHKTIEPRSPIGRAMRTIEGIVKLSGQTAAEIYERSNGAALDEYEQRVREAAHIRLFLLNEENKELSGKFLPPAVAKLAAKVRSSGNSEFERADRRLLFGFEVSGPSKKRYVIVGQRLYGRFGLFGYEPYELLMHVVTILVTAGMVCYWLARYITSPVKKLQAATRRIAEGDLKVRVGAQLSGRKDEIADLGASFDIMTERVESLVDSQRRLLRDISHELRSPLARLGIALELARQRAGTEADSALDRIEREAGRLNELIGELLVVARLESSAEKMDREPVHIPDLLEEIAADARFEARSRNCTVRVSSDADYIVSGKRDLLRSAIENIVRNSVHYTAEGSEVEVKAQSSLEGAKELVCVEVRDHGGGVPDEALSELFRPFYRVGEARDRKRGGVGLGLTIAERAVRLHGGTINAANAPDGGLVVTVLLPVVTL